VDGGASANDALIQFQADILGVPVIRPAVTETTALGAAFLAGLAADFWKPGTLEDLASEKRTFTPRMSRSKAVELKERWKDAISRTRQWEHQHSETAK
jgi:glycerol kinase